MRTPLSKLAGTPSVKETLREEHYDMRTGSYRVRTPRNSERNQNAGAQAITPTGSAEVLVFMDCIKPGKSSTLKTRNPQADRRQTFSAFDSCHTPTQAWQTNLSGFKCGV